MKNYRELFEKANNHPQPLMRKYYLVQYFYRLPGMRPDMKELSADELAAEIAALLDSREESNR